jgi:hypothetical protein
MQAAAPLIQTNAPPQFEVLPTPSPQSTVPPPHHSTTPVPQPAPRPRARNGKIARLPYPERDMVNRMLRNNIPLAKIRDALDEHGIRVTERNISNWKTRGGYRDWCAEQDRAIENQLVQDNLLEHLRRHDATNLPEIGLQLAATSLSQFFAKPETLKQLAAEPDKFAGTVSMLCHLARHLHRLQKYRDDSAKELGPKYNPHRIKNEIEKNVEITRDTFCSFIPHNAPIEPEIPHRNFIPKNYYTSVEPLY